MDYNWEILLTVSPDNLPWRDYKEIQKKAKEAQKIVSTVRSIINDSAVRYKKRKLKARNKAQAEDMALRFADLEKYSSKRDIQDAYGWEFITEREMDRLNELWDLREAMVDENGKYSDPVTDVLELAITSACEPYANLIAVARRMDSIVAEQNQNNIRREVAFEREKYLRGL